jgi:hypothetical protein
MRPTKANLKKIINWDESENIVYTKAEVIEMAYLLLSRRSGRLYLPRPSNLRLGTPRGWGLKVDGAEGIVITNIKIHYFETL